MPKPKVYVHRLGPWYSLYMDPKNETLLASFSDVVSEGGRTTPHIAGDNGAMFRRCGREAIQTLKDYYQGKGLKNWQYHFP